MYPQLQFTQDNQVFSMSENYRADGWYEFSIEDKDTGEDVEVSIEKEDLDNILLPLMTALLNGGIHSLKGEIIKNIKMFPDEIVLDPGYTSAMAFPMNAGRYAELMLLLIRL